MSARRSSSVVFVLVAAAFSIAAACSPADDDNVPSQLDSGADTAPTATSSGTATATSSGTATAGEDSGPPPVCNAISGSDVSTTPFMASPGAAPAATGGVLSDGTYISDLATIYETPTETLSDLDGQKWVVTGTSVQFVLRSSEDATQTATGSGTLTYAGTKLTTNQTCPTVKAADWQLSVESADDGGADAGETDAGATTTGFTIYGATPTGTAGLHFTRH